MSHETDPEGDVSTAGTFKADESFLTDYYEHISSEDLQAYGPETLRRRAIHHAGLARAPGRAVVEVLDETDASIVLVVADEMANLVRSVTAELARENKSVRLLVHPTFRVRRDPVTHQVMHTRHGPSRAGLPSGETGSTDSLHASPTDARSLIGWNTETWVAVEIGRLSGKSSTEDVVTNLQRVLAEVRAVAEDAAAIHAQVVAAVGSADRFPTASVPLPEQVRELFHWLDQGNFTFLGYCEYEHTTSEGQVALRVRPESVLGLLRSNRPRDMRQADTSKPGSGAQQILTIAKSDLRCLVPRPTYLAEVRLQTFDTTGNASGEKRFVGVFSPGAMDQSLSFVPVIRDKVLAVYAHLGFVAESREVEELQSVLEWLPLDEIFQMDVHDLARLVTEMLQFRTRAQTRLFLWLDNSRRFMTALLFLPRRRYNTAARLRIEQELRQAFNASSLEGEMRSSDSPMACLFFRILLTPGMPVPDVDVAVLERRLVAAARSWTEGLEDSLREHFPAEQGARLLALWAGAFSASYRADHEAGAAVEDILRFEDFDLDGVGGRAPDNPLLTLYVRPAPTRTHGEDARIRLYLTRPKSLSQFLPFLHNMGLEVLDERPFEMLRGTGDNLYLYDIGLKYPAGIAPLDTSSLLADWFSAAMAGDIESDAFDALVILERISWRQVAILRAYAKYLKQLGDLNSYGFMVGTLLSNKKATHGLLALFNAKFVPELDWTTRVRNMDAARNELLAAIEEIPSLDADRLLRTFMNLIEATVRTNYFQNKQHLSFKLNPSAIHNSPFPWPTYEIWVYSPRVEGVHLRFGALARGGLRWSDRSEDFRTEILGLVRAQNVKNSIIVPTGAKGGFYPKQLRDPEADRAAWLAEGKEAYRIFIRGMLDLTDNLVSSGNSEVVVSPPNVVRHDGDDYYLVVAADKGTASFSDTANEVGSEYAFWLGDAFASGGSVGYDHKRMGITARGAWESVKQHFKELGLDTQRETFTVAGIGDMSGDVFGNGMLLSHHIQLLAAFDHRHIFLDPSPDPETSYAERQRLFRLPRSSWADYDPRVISDGGGVYSRQAKFVGISEPVRAALDLEKGQTSLTPQELIQAILRAPVDLLYNGGIGTYVKASTETHAEVDDKANDAIRVNGNDIRARVIAEGGNLGITQRGRIEAALGGTILNTDAIDNSAGVDCSDHEVNIKIFVDTMISAGLMHPDERSEFLQSLTDEVAKQVLKHNTDQNTLLLNDRQLVLNWSPGFERTMDWLESTTDLDRNLEGLPSTEDLHARLQQGAGLTSPELSVLMAHAKIELARELSASDLAEDPWFKLALRSYFPRQLVKRFDVELDRHPLRREIICTVVANDMINVGGITFAFRVSEETTASAAAVARAFVAMREAYDLDWFAGELAKLPPDFPSEQKCAVALDLRRLLDRGVRWYVTHNYRDQPIDKALARIAPTLEQLRTHTKDYLRGVDIDRLQDRLTHSISVGLPLELSKRTSDLLESFLLLDVSAISELVSEPATSIVDVYCVIAERFDFDSLATRISDLPRESRWAALARAALRDDLYSALADMTLSVMQSTRPSDTGSALERIVTWESGHQEQLARIKEAFAEVTNPGEGDIASISVALKLLRTLVRSELRFAKRNGRGRATPRKQASGRLAPMTDVGGQ